MSSTGHQSEADEMLSGHQSEADEMLSGHQSEADEMLSGHESEADEMLTRHESEDGEMSLALDGQKFIGDISSYYLNEDLSDATILVGNEKFPVHKQILASKSQYFATWFYENPDRKEMTISRTPSHAFQILLKYIYTGSIPSENESMLQLLILTRHYILKESLSDISSKNGNILDIKNVVFFLNGASEHNLDELRNACLSFMDANAQEILLNDTFKFLTRKSLIQILKRDTFSAPEIEIFKSVAKWCETNNDSDSSILECIHFSALNMFEILSVVWPTKLVNTDKLLQIISGKVRNRSEVLLSTELSSVDGNVATLERGAQVTFSRKSAESSSGDRNVRNKYPHTMDEENTIVIKLGKQYPINYIHMKLYDFDDRCYSYYIETSLDQKNWQRIIDYRGYSCRSFQNLYFDRHTVQYIKIVGTSTYVRDDYFLHFCGVSCKNVIPRIIDGVIRPEKNVATKENGAQCTQGLRPRHLLNGNEYVSTYHVVGQSQPVMVQLAQPYMISSIMLKLNRDKYKYYIETSVNGKDWEIAVDRRNQECTGLQNLRFEERVVVYIRIAGIYAPHRLFDCYHFECPSSK